MPTKPTGHHLEQLTQALLNAFTYDELTIFTRHKLDQSLEQVTPVRGTNKKITAELVYRFARQENGLQNLLNAAISERPKNPQLKQLTQEWQGIEFEPFSSAAGSAQTTSQPTGAELPPNTLLDLRTSSRCNRRSSRRDRRIHDRINRPQKLDLALTNTNRCCSTYSRQPKHKR